MAKFVYKNAFLDVNAVDLSDRIESLTLNVTAETPETTAMSDGTRQRVASFIDWSFDVTFRQDFAASNVDATLFSLVGAAEFAIIIRPDAGVKSASNPEFTGNALLASYSPMSGTVGDVAAAPSTFQGSGVLARATS